MEECFLHLVSWPNNYLPSLL